MSRPSVLFCLVLLACAILTAVPTRPASAAGVRESLPDDISIELLGKCIIYNFGYQHMLGSRIGLEAGLGALGGGSDEENTTVVFVPLGARFYLMPKEGSVFLTGGVVLITASFDSGPFDEDESDSYGYVGAGMEYRSPGGLLFRGTAYGLLAGGGFFIWPGLSVGYAF